MNGAFNNIKIQGISTAIPKNEEANETYAGILGSRRVKRQMKITGVKKRRLVGRHQRASDLCYEAALPLLEKLKWDPQDIDVLILVTQSPNYSIPSTAFFLQKRLQIPKDCIAFDINLGCSSFNAGVHVVSALLQDCRKNAKGLLLLADSSGSMLNPCEEINDDTIANRMLFGSAGAAIAIEKVENHKLLYMNKSDGNGYEAIIGRPGRTMNMNGGKVFDFAINEVSKDINWFRNEYNLKDEDIDYYVFHQAQKLILDSIIDDCDIVPEKELRSVELYGNTSGASVPVSLCANREKYEKRDKIKVLFSGFGVGLSWGIIYTEIDTENILPVLETDAHCEEDKLPGGALKDQMILVSQGDSVLGECIGRFVNSCSAETIFMGDDEEKLQSICDDLYYQAYAEATKSIASLVDESEKEIDTVIFSHADKEIEQIEELYRFCHEKSRTMRIILITTKDSSDQVMCLMQKLEEEMMSQTVQINAISYVPDKMEIHQMTGDGQSWVEAFLEKGRPEEMKRQLQLGDTIRYLAGYYAKNVSGSLIRIEK